MAKKSMINREEKRRKLVAKYAAKREALLAKIQDMSLSEEERMQARLELQQLPRNASPTRLRNRCAITGRPRGTFPQIRAVPPQAARDGFPWRSPRHDQGELVRESEDEHV